MKVIILGGRSGTSAMYRILRASFLACWGHTEPPRVADLILDNLDDPAAIREGLKPLEDYDLAKCPEFAFCTDILLEMYPDCRFIWMQRPIGERVESHRFLGWDIDIHEKVLQNTQLQALMEKKPSIDPEVNDYRYFELMDRLNDRLVWKHYEKVLEVEYSVFNTHFDSVMNRVANFLKIKFNPEWRKIKNKKHQGGRWSPQ